MCAASRFWAECPCRTAQLTPRVQTGMFERSLSLTFSRFRALSLTNAHKQALHDAETDPFTQRASRLGLPFAQLDPPFAAVHQRRHPQGECQHPELEAPGEGVAVGGVGAKGTEDLHGGVREAPWVKTERSSHGRYDGRIDCANGRKHLMRAMKDAQNQRTERHIPYNKRSPFRLLAGGEGTIAEPVALTRTGSPAAASRRVRY